MTYKIIFRGEELSLKEISERTGVPYPTVCDWRRRGLSIQEMLDIKNGEKVNIRKCADIRGQKFGRLTAIEPVGTHRTSGQPNMSWRCVCDCGRETIASVNNLKGGSVTSCGCVGKKVRAENIRKYSSVPRLYFDIDGKSMSMKDISERFGISIHTIRDWRSDGMDIPVMVWRTLARRGRKAAELRDRPFRRSTGTIWIR